VLVVVHTSHSAAAEGASVGELGKPEVALAASHSSVGWVGMFGSYCCGLLTRRTSVVRSGVGVCCAGWAMCCCLVGEVGALVDSYECL
jgi:hypothetical protein